MGELDHHCRAVLMARVGEPAQPGNNLVLIGEDIVQTGGLSGDTAAEPAVIVKAMPAFARST